MNILLATISLAAAVSTANPWLEKWDTPYGIPPFEKLETALYVDAVKAAVQEKREEIAAITAVKDPPTFANTVAPFARCGNTLSRISAAFSRLLALENNDERDRAAKEAISFTSALSSEIATNAVLFARIKAVYDGDKSGLSAEEKSVLRHIYRSFALSGIGLPPEKQKRLQEIRKRNSELSLRFSRNVLYANNEFKKKFGFTVGEFYEKLAVIEDRELRKAVYEAYKARGYSAGGSDNRALIKEILAIRIEKAALLGYPTPADMLIEPRMAKTVGNVSKFLEDIYRNAERSARKEIELLQKEMDEDVKRGLLPKGSRLMAWDCDYYAERIKKRRYAFSDAEVARYFKLENVLKSAFAMAEKLYGIRFTEIPDAPTYRPGATQAYKVTDADGSYIGVFITDFRPRPSKRGGACMALLTRQTHTAEGKDVRPVVMNCCNFGEYLQVNNVKTLFHEFGHALHGLLSRCQYPTLSCTGRYSDYSEVFSQFHEHWALMPELLGKYAVDEKTGKTIPLETVEKIKRLESFNSGFRNARMCATSMLDLELHRLGSVEGFDIEKFEKDFLADLGVDDVMGIRHRPAHFSHIFTGEHYAAGYYTYTWAEVLETHLFSVFEESPDPWQRERAMKFRRIFLERGGTEDPIELFRRFTGTSPDQKAFYRHKGFFK